MTAYIEETAACNTYCTYWHIDQCYAAGGGTFDVSFIPDWGKQSNGVKFFITIQ